MIYLLAVIAYTLGDTPMEVHPQTDKKPKGYPRVRASNKRLQLTYTYQGERISLSLGMADTPTNRQQGERIALMIWNDIQLNRYDSSNLSQYLPHYSQKNTQVVNVPTIKYLWELWDKYVIEESASFSGSTVKTKFPSITRFLHSNKDLLIDDAEEFVKRIGCNLSHLSLNTKYSIVRSCISWGVREKILSRNSFKDYTLPRNRKHVERGGDPFETWEIKQIIESFQLHKGEEWTTIIKFLLLTGCRPSEAFGLQFRDVNLKSKKLTFQRRRLKNGGKVEVIEGLKTQDKRVFPISGELETLLNEIKTKRNPSGSDFVLTVGGLPVHSSQLGRHWYGKKTRNKWSHKGVVTSLAEEGLIDHYRSPYSLRDSFITHSLKAGVPVHTVAKWCGNSPAIIDKHYASSLSEFSPPSLL
jgi:integrase